MKLHWPMYPWIYQNSKDMVHVGKAICGAGWALRGESDQQVIACVDSVTCQNCLRRLGRTDHLAEALKRRFR